MAALGAPRGPAPGAFLALAAMLALVPGGGALARDRADEMREAKVLYERANPRIAKARAAYQRALVAALDSPSPYTRHLVLETLEKLGHVPDDAATPRLLRILEETEPLPSEACAATPATCTAEQKISNGALASRVLPPSFSVSEHVARNPSSVEALIASYQHRARFYSPPIVKAIASTTAPASQAALLRLALTASKCELRDPKDLAPVVGLLGSTNRAVRDLAAIATLKLTECYPPNKAFEPMRNPALAAVEARLRDPADRDVVRQIALLGEGGRPLIPSLVARMERTKAIAERRALLEAIRAPRYEAQAAVPLLLRMLRDPGARALRGDVLVALRYIGPGSSGAAAEAVLDVALTDPEHFTAALESLVQCSGKLGPNAFARLDAGYRHRCASKHPAADCGRQRSALLHLSEAADLAFEPVDDRATPSAE